MKNGGAILPRPTAETQSSLLTTTHAGKGSDPNGDLSPAQEPKPRKPATGIGPSVGRVRGARQGRASRFCTEHEAQQEQAEYGDAGHSGEHELSHH